MDEYNINEMSGQPPKETPFKKWSFYVAYLAAAAPLFIISCIEGKFIGWGIYLLNIPYAIVGLIIWAIVGFAAKKKTVALGILLGSLTPAVFMFVATDGCGLVRF